MQLPPCGLYRTLGPIGSVPSGRLVYFHNHGEPGPGLYLPTGWTNNRVEIAERGNTLSDTSLVRYLEPLPPEGLYRVTEAFHCCERKCTRFEPETLVELGYNGEGQAIVFSPELVDGQLVIPASGTAIDHARLVSLKQLRVPLITKSKSGAGALH